MIGILCDVNHERWCLAWQSGWQRCRPVQRPWWWPCLHLQPVHKQGRQHRAHRIWDRMKDYRHRKRRLSAANSPRLGYGRIRLPGTWLFRPPFCFGRHFFSGRGAYCYFSRLTLGCAKVCFHLLFTFFLGVCRPKAPLHQDRLLKLLAKIQVI